MFVHEESYEGIRFSSVVHRARLAKILSLMRTLPFPLNGTIADFGCSNGFLFEVFRASIPEIRTMRMFGYDHSNELLDAARRKNIENTTFEHIDLNSTATKLGHRFDVVTCFETLEHVGSPVLTLNKLLESCKPNGTVVISVPREIGFAGLIKYLGRKLVRKNPYGDFFESRAELKYFWRLVVGKSIAEFRTPYAASWGPHLGFDWTIIKKYLDADRSWQIAELSSFFFGVIMVIRRRQVTP